MLPGQHVIIIGTEVDALAARAAGLSLRDTILILLPGVTTVYAFLFRMPIEGTVADNVMKHGTGVLNIDACRVGTTKRVPGGLSRTKGSSLSGSVDGSLRHETGQEGGHNPNIGRWPTNMILIHGPGCNNAERACQTNCPVKVLDAQSFDRGIHPAGNIKSITGAASAKGYQASAFGKESRKAGSEHPFYQDAGGASRFFPQFAHLRAALNWMRRIAGCSASPLDGGDWVL